MKKKRLLVLGGGIFVDEIIQYAQKNDIWLVTTGVGRTNHLKTSIEESYDISTTSIKEMEQLIIEKQIDGVFMGGNEDNISATLKYLPNLGMSNYVSQETWRVASNKELFKKECSKIGLPVPVEYNISEIDEEFKEFPIVLKPVDSCGSKGVVLCNDYGEFLQKYNKSKSFSKSNRVLAEEYLKGCEISVHYTIKDGEAKLSSMSDKYESTHCGDFNPIPDCYCYPSVYLDEFMKKYDGKIKQLFKRMGINKGICFVQGFHENGDFKFFEMGYRIPGTLTFKYTKYLNHISALDLILDYSIGIPTDSYDLGKENAYFKKYCCTLTLLSRGGVVRKVDGLEKIRKNPNVISVEERYDPGETIQVTNSLAQAHIWVYIVASTVKELKETIRFVNDIVAVWDNNGQDMLYHDFNPERLMFQDKG